jgi:putative membrane protein
MTALHHKQPGAAILAGAIGGLFGAWFKLGWEVPWPPRAVGRIPEPMVLVSMFTHAPTPLWVSYVIHFSFSVLSGIAYGALVEYVPIVALGSGVAFGIAIWVGAHEIVMPAMGLTPATWDLPLNEQGSEFFGHALWGLVIGVFFSFYRTRLAKPVSPPTKRVLEPIRIPVAESVAVFESTNRK